MKLDEKRKVIEVLLCAADRSCGCSHASDGLGLPVKYAIEASAQWRERFVDTDDDYTGIAVEAAYRLIELDATLRREWFGR